MNTVRKGTIVTLNDEKETCLRITDVQVELHEDYMVVLVKAYVYTEQNPDRYPIDANVTITLAQLKRMSDKGATFT